MSIHVALLRAVNVGGRNMIAMSDLRDLCTALGFEGARTLLQSGNLVFRGDRRTGATLERLFEKETEKRFALTVDYVVRSANEWDDVVSDNPFPKEAKSDPGHLVVMFMKVAPEASDVKSLQAAIKGPEIIRAKGKHLYITYPASIGTSKLTGTLIEKKLGTRGTGRNWNTVLKLEALARE